MNAMLLEDCCEILDNLRVPITASERKSGPYPYYGANGIQDYVDEYIFDDELVLLAEDGGNFGSKTRPIAYRVSGKCWVNNHAHVLKPKPGLDVDFLCYSLMFYKTDGLVNGATRQKLTQATMRKMLIPNMTLENQRIVVDKLNRVLSIKSKREKQLVKLDELIKARFVEMFGALNNTSYETLPLGDICEFIKDGTHQTPTYTEDKVRGYKFLSSKDVTSQKISWSNIKYIPESLHNELYSKLAPRRGDILLAKNGTTGLAAIVDTDEVFDIYVSLALLRPKVGYNSRYLWAVINSNDTKMQFNANLKGIGVPNLHLGEIKKAKVIVPPLEQQEKFAVFLEQIDKSKVAIQKSLAETQLLFDKLMQDYFG